MSNKSVLAVFFVATVGVAAGSAWAASSSSSSGDPAQTAAMRDFGKLSADGVKAFQDLTLTRLAIYDGKTDQAKTYADEADKAFIKAKADDSVFTKAEHELMTADQMAAKKSGEKSGEKSGAKSGTTSSETADTKPAGDKAASNGTSAPPVAWLPVDGGVSIDEDYRINPAKTKAVSDANKSLAKGDRKGAMDRLKLADVSTSVILEVVPVDQTISDVHQAAQLIDSGKYYEGSQMLRKVQMAARYDLTEVVGTPKAATGTSPQPEKPAQPATH